MSAPTQIGQYSVTREIGRGGMGVVYLAHDTRLDRAVAVKALPDHLAGDAERLSRFEREARTLAALNHPNIAGIYAIEEHEGHKYLVLEFIEGETLAERLDRGPVSLHDTIELASQIAAGVETAHDAGIIHRDLKPANIKIAPEGRAVVLDFGLAKATEALSSSGSHVTSAATLTATPHSPTIPGAILGTAPYMSPEQARGKPLDKRSDIWSFAVILYECLTGDSPFVGETVTDSIGAILHKDVDLERLPAETPQSIRRLLRRCLQRDKHKRLRDIGDARVELEETLHAPDAIAATSPPPRRSRTLTVAAALLGIIIGAAAMWGALGDTPTEPTSTPRPEPRRYTITLPPEAPIAPPSVFPFGIARSFFDLSPDGSSMVYTALVDGRKHIYIRDMSTGDVRPVPGGLDGFGAVFSHDAREIAFFANERLYRTAIDQRTDPEPLAVTTSPTGAAWAADGTIYFSPAEMTPIFALSRSGAAETPVTTFSRGSSHNWPRLALDDRVLLFTNYTDVPNAAIAGTDGTFTQRTLLEHAASPWITPSGHFLFTRENRLLAASIDPTTLELRTDPKTVLSDVRTSWSSGQYDIAHDGTLVFVTGTSDEAARFVWLDRAGEITHLDLGLRAFVAFSLSPDGRFLATPISEGRDTDIWVYELQRPQTPARVTFGGVHNATAWSSCGRYLLFGKYEADGSNAFFAKDVRSGAPAFVIHRSDADGAPLQYHTPSDELLFSSVDTERGSDLMSGTIDLSKGDGATLENIRTVRATRYGEPFAAISPDRNWIVANSDETGRWELYLSSYPDFNSRTQLSTTGGEEPLWTDDGSRVIYRWRDTWYEVEVTTEPRLSASPPRVIASGPYINVAGYSWDMSPDGERLLLLEGPQQDTPVTELQVITNFFTELERRVPHPTRTED